MTPKIGIIGKGYCLPANIRTNDDPIFDWLKEHNPSGSDLFKGYKYRRYLANDENITNLMTEAALKALEDAHLEPQDIDFFMGYASVGEFNTPNTLLRVHQQIGLSPTCTTVPIQADFNNFNYALLFADSLIKTRKAKKILIVTASNWTKYVDYHTPASLSVSDGAGAVVVSSTEKEDSFSFVDYDNQIDTQYYGTMYVQPDLVGYKDDQAIYSCPYFHLTTAGQMGFSDFGMNAPPMVVNRLLEKNKISSEEICLISHQSSAVLMDAWQNAINPRQYINTLEDFANPEVTITTPNFPVLK